MAKNKKRTNNSIEVGSLAKWVFMALFLGILGICFVSVKNRLHDYGRIRSGLEVRLNELKEENNVMYIQIVRWGSRSMLQERLELGFIDMVPISDERIVRLQHEPAVAYDEIRAVSNSLD